MKAHLLYRDRDFDADGVLPVNHQDLIADLELGALIAAMAGGDRYLANVATRVLLTSCTAPEEVRYRQGVLGDALAHPDLIRDLYALTVEVLEARRSVWGYSSISPSSVLSGAVSHLQLYARFLRRLRALGDANLGLVSSEGLTTLFRTLQNELDDAYLATVEQQLRRLRFRDGVLLSARLARDNTGLDYVLRVPEREKPGWKERLGFAPRTSYSFTLSPRDEPGSQALSDLTSRGINEVANAAAQAADHIASYFTMLRLELGFYVCCLNLHQQLTAGGHPYCIPEVSPVGEKELRFEELRDAALCLHAQHQVIGNTAVADDVSALIVTGANSGGKSTFLRSLGLAQLMAQAGMFVVANQHRVSLCSGLFTHFIREEDTSMRAGRLEEEIARMSALADAIRPGALVLFNESFSSTNEREGSEIARQVVRALREAGSRVVFVSHQFDFADSFRSEEGGAALFLRAVRHANGERDYRLVSGAPLPTAYGPDLYKKIFGAVR